MYTYKAIIFYMLQKNYNFFFAVIISVDNQTLMIALKSQFSRKIKLLSSKCINTSIKLNHKINTIFSVFNS